MNIFERASRSKIRFKTAKGHLPVEELWDLNLKSLNSLAMEINRRLKDSKEESFIEIKSKEQSEDELSLEILKHIINAKLAAEEASKKASDTRAKNERIKDLILQKKDAELAGKSIDELTKMIEEESE